VAVTTFSAGTTGFTPSTATSGAITLAGTLATTNGGTGLTSFTANGVLYASSTSALATGSALTFDGTNLGVGTTSPNKLSIARSLTVNSTSGFAGLELTVGNASTFDIITDGGNAFISTRTNIPLVFQTNNAEQMRLTSTGLGIGTSSPAQKLNVVGNVLIEPSAAFGYAEIKNQTSTAGSILRFTNGSTTSYFGKENSAGNYTWSSGGTAYATVISAYGSTAPIQFGHNTPSMTLDSSGNLGIGTSSPAAKLEIFQTSTTVPNLRLRYNSTTYFADFQLAPSGNSLINIPAANGVASGSFAINLNGTSITNRAYSIYSNGYHEWASGTGTVFMNLDSSGNLGLGVTPSAWDSWTGKGIIQFGNSGASLHGGGTGWSSASFMYLGNNSYYGTSAFRYYQTGASAQYVQGGAEHQWRIANSGTAGNAISFTQAMTLDANGSLAVGGTTVVTNNGGITATTTVSGSVAATLAMRNAGTGNGSGTTLVFRGVSNASAEHDYAYVAGVADDTTAKTGSIRFSTTAGSSPVERARITSDGNLLVGTTASTIATITQNSLVARVSNGSLLVHHENGNTGSDFAGFGYDSSTIGTISQNSTTTVGYNTSSDYRLKNTIAPMTGALAKVALLKPVTYKWNADGSDGQGFIAHELAEIVPECVNGEKDAVDEDGNPKYQGIDTSFLVATLTAAIQELKAELDSVKAELATLKGK
jgi:hypothetical protein